MLQCSHVIGTWFGIPNRAEEESYSAQFKRSLRHGFDALLQVGKIPLFCLKVGKTVNDYQNLLRCGVWERDYSMQDTHGPPPHPSQSLTHHCWAISIRKFLRGQPGLVSSVLGSQNPTVSCEWGGETYSISYSPPTHINIYTAPSSLYTSPNASSLPPPSTYHLMHPAYLLFSSSFPSSLLPLHIT